MVNGLRKIAWASVSRSDFFRETLTFPNILIPCLHALVHFSMSSSSSPCSCPNLCPSPCFHVLVQTHVLIPKKIPTSAEFQKSTSALLQTQIRIKGKRQLSCDCYTRKTDTANFRFWLQTENGSLFLWSANGKRYSTIAVSAKRAHLWG
jgi:hypothetical protein